MPPPALIDQGQVVFGLSVCLSVHLFVHKNKTLAIAFEWWDRYRTFSSKLEQRRTDQNSPCDFLTHYQTTNFRLFQTERVCRRQFQIWRKWKKVIQTGRKHCGKRRNCSLRAISPFPTVFSEGLFHRGVKKCFQKACFPEASERCQKVWEWV